MSGILPRMNAPFPPYAPGAPPLGNPRAMTERSPATVVILGIVTCGVYLLIWGYQTTEELRVATGDESLKPGLDLLLTFLTCGIWWIYTDYRNAKKVWELGNRMGLRRSDQSTIVLILDFVAMLITPAVLQTEYNEIAKAAKALGPSGY